MPLNQRSDALLPQIEQLKRARRLLERSVDASGKTLGAVVYKQSPVRLRVGLLFLFAAVVALAAMFYLPWTHVFSPRARVRPEPVIHSQPAASNRAEASVVRVPVEHTLVIHIHATRACRVRIVVDGTPLDWKILRPGDEFFSRPRQHLILESDDGGALAATVNGVPISLAPDGRAIAVRLTTDRPYPEPISLP